jgi:hypothetical protein
LALPLSVVSTCRVLYSKNLDGKFLALQLSMVSTCCIASLIIVSFSLDPVSFKFTRSKIDQNIDSS